jgi:Tol biopolymer transport system component/tRNA A-37 threonylcarbamoyl transferase component Bud32
VDSLLEKLTTALTGHYVVLRELGSGGMATVYLAEDIRHHRKVAVKVLRPELALSLGAERFLREIDIAAQLQHPNILPLLDSGSADGLLYYVMPYVEGESLRDRLTREGEFPVREAVRILCEVTDALSLAHRHGVVHRDIKPGNILLSGRHALVADFGVAKAVSEATGRQSLTSAGVALGTPAYMAPEQASADPHIDHRADIYAVGVLAYELLTGRPPFTASSSQAILVAHMTQTPDPISKYRPGIPPALDQVVARCLAKRPADRWQSAGEVLSTLETLTTPSGGTTPTSTQPARPIRRNVPIVIGVAAGMVLLAATGALLLRNDHGPPPLTLGRTRQITNAAGLELDPALSPDGKLLAYAAGPLPRMHIYVRQIAGGRPVDVTTGLDGTHRSPQWSRDGTQLLFVTTRQDTSFVNIAPALGGPAQHLVRVVRPGGTGITSVAWSPDAESIAYATPGAVMVQKADGGEPRSIVAADDPHSLSWSPDGSWIAYVEGNSGFVFGRRFPFGNLAPSPIYMVAVSGAPRVAVTSGEFQNVSPAWSSDGRSLLFVSNRDGRRDLYRVRVRRSGEATGTPERVTTGLAAQSLGLAADGKTLAYSALTLQANVWWIRIPSRGSVSVAEAEPVTFGNRVVENSDVSPDGRWLAFDSDHSGNFEIYRLPLAGGEIEQLTTDPADDFAPSWSPDGAEIAFHSFRKGNRDVFVMPAGGGGAQQVTTGPEQDLVARWSPDGNRLAFIRDSARREVYIVERKERAAMWGTPRRLTDGGGTEGIWSVDGRRIFYLAQRTIREVSLEEGKARILYRPQNESRSPVPLVIRLTADGRTIVFRGQDSEGRGSFWSIPVTGGTPRLLVRFDVPGRESLRGEFNLSDDRIYFTITNHESDIYTVELQ